MDRFLMAETSVKKIMQERTFRELSEREKLLAYRHLEELRQLNGGYVASPYRGENGGDRYYVYWLRDIMYATYANEYVGAYDKMIETATRYPAGPASATSWGAVPTRSYTPVSIL
jgi:hypothetical protein